MNDSAQFWADPRLVYTVATAAVLLLLATIWLFRRSRRSGRQAGMICLFLSIALHTALLILVPLLPARNGGSSTADPNTNQEAGIDSISFSTFDPDMIAADAAGEEPEAVIAPLPVAALTELLAPSAIESSEPEPSESDTASEPAALESTVPASLASSITPSLSDSSDPIESDFADQLDQVFAAAADPVPDVAQTPTRKSVHVTDQPGSKAPAPSAAVPGEIQNDFANRVGRAKQEALLRTGGSAETEAAVAAALKYLADSQRADGAWDPRSTGAGQERSPLGMSRGAAGTRCETAITGLALLTLLGAGETHREGEYADNVYRGLVYLVRNQHPNGSLAGKASIYAANYSHGMASLAICETAAITKDPTAIDSATRAIRFTQSMQHPTTGGWRYTAGDPGDLSQLGWQAMVLDAGHRAEVPIQQNAISGVQRFLRSVRGGSSGGLACYRSGEAISRTMTAEALATRLLIEGPVPTSEVNEAERYLLQQPPGVGQDNYYYWYYATLALHQLQDDAWEQWNESLKTRLLATQRNDGSWPTNSLWGGYGGSVYSTSMAALCLEVYYRHALRE